MREGRDLSRRDPTAVAEERRRFIDEIATLLETSPIIRDPDSRRVLYDMLRDSLRGDLPVREVAVLRPQLVSLINVCIERTGALRALAECIEVLEPGSIQTVEILRAADRWQVADQFQDRDLEWLRTELAALRITPGLRQFVHDMRGEPVPQHCEHVWHLFAYLSSTNPVEGLPPWLLLLDRLILMGSSSTELPALVNSLAAEWGATDRLHATRSRPFVGIDDRHTAYLVIQFEKYGGEDDTFIVSHWYQWASPEWKPIPGDDRYVRYDDLESAVDEIVLETERRWADRVGDVTIEFVLPWQLLNEPVDRWRKELDSDVPSPLAMEYPLVVRSLERIRAVEWHRVWRGRWQRLLDPSDKEDRLYCATGNHGAVQLEAILRGKAGAVVLVLSEPPTLNSVGQQEVRAGLRSGFPAIVWHRAGASVSDELCETIKSMIDDGESASGLAELPKHAAKLRQVAWSEDPGDSDPHIGHDLVVLWDDPERQPGRATGKVHT
ncbi:hypothetical protein GCM10009557_41680 [Virgisporangium ochraceum]|uniref:Uncharacterized protein n=1 Tax=Virgisporangium ochraceum TaxID=65505 RepID=A0A8J4A2L2_9ACTN|nr:hypothetical protein [Virgisporangium ochraceum]GIJ74699.1 hypothetical protein Voc01_096160 [Virgisporangium ochraceum]